MTETVTAAVTAAHADARGGGGQLTSPAAWLTDDTGQAPTFATVEAALGSVLGWECPPVSVAGDKRVVQISTTRRKEPPPSPQR